MEYKLRDSILPIEDYYNVVETVFAARGIPPEKIDQYRNVSKSVELDSLLLDNLDKGVELLAKHITALSPALIIVDSDMDGYTSASLLLNYLNKIAPWYTQNKIKYITHKVKQHGFTEDILNRIPKDTKLILMPDAGSSDFEAHKVLKDKGIDILILDHHDSPRVSEDAVVINNQLSINYKNKSLSGVGVSYKFCEYIDSILNFHYADDLLDLAAAGLVGDQMDVRNLETRYLISEGLEYLQNPFLKEMAKVQSFSINKAGGLCPFSVAFYIVPLVNAVTRIGEMEEKILLFESMLEYKAFELIPSTKRGHKGENETKVEQACRVCQSVKRRQTKLVEDNLGIIENIIESKQLDNNKIIAVKISKENPINQGLTGLLANQIMAKYKHPILILNEKEENGEISWFGSGRGFESKDFADFRAFIEESGYVVFAQGL